MFTVQSVGDKKSPENGDDPNSDEHPLGDPREISPG
jgi:hypothetical protein